MTNQPASWSRKAAAEDDSEVEATKDDAEVESIAVFLVED